MMYDVRYQQHADFAARGTHLGAAIQRALKAAARGFAIAAAAAAS